MKAATTAAVVTAVALTALGAGGAWGYATQEAPAVLVDPAPPAPDPHDVLISRLPADVFVQCTPDSDREDESGGRVASLTCLTPVPGADELLVSQWATAEEMLTTFAEDYGGKPEGRCGEYTGEPAEGRRSTWGDGYPLTCYANANQAAVVQWEYPEAAVQVLAVRRDGDAAGLFEWWRAASDTPLR